MPREQINHPAGPVTPEERHDTVLHVSWAKNDVSEHVQISMELDVRTVHMLLETPNGRDGRTLAYTPVLTRDEINRLIRVLRKARDQAYGQDA